MDAIKPFSSVKADDFRNRMEYIVRHPPGLLDEAELQSRVAAELERRNDALQKRRSLVISSKKGFYGEKLQFDIDELQQQQQEQQLENDNDKTDTAPLESPRSCLVSPRVFLSFFFALVSATRKQMMIFYYSTQ